MKQFFHSTLHLPSYAQVTERSQPLHDLEEMAIK